MLIQLENDLRHDHGTFPRPMTKSEIGLPPDVGELEKEIRSTIRGEVRFDDGSRALYATDASNYRQVPIGVVIPRDKDDVVRTVAACHRHKVPILNRGGGTSLAGECCNVAVVIDMSKYMRKVLHIDPERKLGTVEPGCVLDDFRAAALKHTLTFGPDPATHTHCTLGGMAGNNSCGMHAQMAGKTSENIERMEILTYDGLRMWVGATNEEELEQFIAGGGRKGEIYRRLKALRDRYADRIRARFPKIPRLVSGYPLDKLLPENGFHVARALVGTESTCVTILEIEGNLVYSPPIRNLLVLGYPDVYRAGDHIPEVIAHKPLACEGLDDRLLGYYRKKGIELKDIALMPEGKGWLVLEFGGETKEEADDRARALMEELKKKSDAPTMKLYDNKKQEQQIWDVRESGLGATAFVPGEKDTWPGWEDSAVPPEKVGSYLRDLDKLFGKYDLEPALYGHFGQGCIHCRVPFDLFTAKGLEAYRSFMDEASTLVVRYGGSLSGEHGDGQARAEFLPKMFGPELVEAFEEFKSIWDPDWKMNPGKVVRPYTITQNLRLGTNYDPPQPKTHFHYESDQFSFARATLRCVGVGNCRRESTGTMCPSYQATHEEMHSTRGRTRLLFEMMQGDPLKNGWRDEHVKEALDLCLSCKGCKGECPVNVDMATYKAEFLSHYYEGRPRPRHAYAAGLIYWWARAASTMPALANIFTQTSPFSSVAKWFANYDQKRHIPPFAPQTFRQWFQKRGVRNQGRPQVILWADTFNNHFTPKVAKAAVEVLEHAGFQVCVPRKSLCCGRPLYDYGMLDLAEHLLHEILDSLRPAIQKGIPVVGLEPSCVSVFRDEMTNLIHGDQDAERLRGQTFLLSDFLEKAADYRPPQLHRKAVVHGHCHHKSVLGFGQEENLLKKMGLDCEVLDSGCCGMAGAFGYEKDHYDVSIKCGERVLLPAVRQAGRDAIIITDGFSCREQILQETDRRALHVAQVMQMALHEGPQGPVGELPETKYARLDGTNALPAALWAGAGALAAIGAFAAIRKARSHIPTMHKERS